nr:NAD-dependent epimerase/dehydratase family protein [Lacticaseibacillus camelliae]
MIGSFLVDVLMQKNLHENLNLQVFALGRSEEHAKAKFGAYWADPRFTFVSHDVNKPMTDLALGQVDFVLHLASNTHPRAYATDPIGTITANIIGTQNLLDFAVAHHSERFAFASSNEIYGENRGDVDLFDEDYCGYLNSNTLRAGYPESKRAGEALCQAYKTQKGLDVVIPRLTRTYGPTMASSDSKAIAQFLENGLTKQNIVLKSKGTQLYSFTYVPMPSLVCLPYCSKVSAARHITLRILTQTSPFVTSLKPLPTQQGQRSFSICQTQPKKPASARPQRLYWTRQNYRL